MRNILSSNLYIISNDTTALPLEWDEGFREKKQLLVLRSFTENKKDEHSLLKEPLSETAAPQLADLRFLLLKQSTFKLLLDNLERKKKCFSRF